MIIQVFYIFHRNLQFKRLFADKKKHNQINRVTELYTIKKEH